MTTSYALRVVGALVHHVPMADNTHVSLVDDWWDKAPYLLDLIAIGPTALCSRAQPDPQSDSMAEGLGAFDYVDHQQECTHMSPCRTIIDLVQRGRVREAERLAESHVL